MDQHQRVVARSRDPAKWIGRAATGPVKERAERGEGGFAESVTLDGVTSRSYLAAPNRYGWATIVALPLANLTATAKRLTAQALAAAAALLAAGLAAALVMSRQIARPVLSLRDAAAELAEDRVPGLVRTGVLEADAVLSVLHRAGQRSVGVREELRRRVEAAVADARQAQAQLLEAQKHEAIGRLVGNVARDFNNLLQTITAGVQLALRSQPQARAEKALDAALRAGAKAARLIRQMLSFGRADRYQPRAVSLNDWVLGNEDLLRKALRADIRFRASVEPSLHPLRVDPMHFELALLNLLFNARDAMPAGGEVTLTAQVAAEGEREGLAPGDYAAIVIADTGDGMDPEVQAKAMQAYFTTKPVGEGTGLGLAQVTEFARQSGGAFRLDSPRGEGTRVTLVLPITGEPDNSDGEPAVPPPSARRLHVLMVEDDALAASVVVPAQELAGHRVHLTASADEARALLERGERFDVLFTDVVMPGKMNGIDLVRWVAIHRPELPAVVATGYSPGALDPGVVVLHKPYRLDAVLSALCNAADAASAAQPPESLSDIGPSPMPGEASSRHSR